MGDHLKDFTIICPDSGFVEDQFSIPTLSPLLLQAWYRSKGVNTAVHYMHEHNNDLSTIPKSKVYGITVVTPNFYECARIYIYLKLVIGAELVIAGGPHVSADPEYCVGRICDLAIVGPGESIDIVDIIMYGNGKIYNKHNIKCDVFKTNDVDYSVEYSNISLDYSNIDISRYKSWLLMTDVGCRGNCRFCYKNSSGKRIHCFPSNFISRCIADYSNFSSENKWLKLTSDNVFWKIFSGNDVMLNTFLSIGRAGIPFEVCSRFDDIDREKLQFAISCGCKMIKFGMESGSDRILSLMNKKITVDEMLKKSKIIKDSSIKFGVYIITQFPGETEEDRNMTVDVIGKMKPDWFSIYRFIPYPGTYIWNNMSDIEKNKYRFNSFRNLYHAGKECAEDNIISIMNDRIKNEINL